MRGVRGIAYAIIPAACLAVSFAARPAAATPFAFVGPRAVGMGGAGVAATNDAHAVYWNPGALANSRGLDIRISGTVTFVNQTGVEDIIKDIKDIDTSDLSPENLARYQELLNRLSEGDGVQVNGGGGGFLKFNWGNNFFGIDFIDVAFGTGNIPLVDTQVAANAGHLFNGTLYRLSGLEARQIGVSYAYSMFDDTLALGVTGYALEGVAYFNASLLKDSDTGLNVVKGYSVSRSDYEPSVDVGAVYNPTTWLRFAIVGKYLNRPTFDIFKSQQDLVNTIISKLPPGVTIPDAVLAAQSRKLELAPQGRASVAVFPIDGMTLTADADIAPNPTFIQKADSQIISVGGEQTFLDRMLAARLGLYYDFVAPSSDVVPTVGFGVELFGVSMDLGGAYDFKKENAALGVGFGYRL